MTPSLPTLPPEGDDPLASPRTTAPARPAALLWDFDGTLADTEPLWIAAEYDLIGRLGGSWSD